MYDTVCTSRSMCTRTQWEQLPKATDADNHCRDLTLCSEFQYENSVPTAYSDRVCKNLTTCTVLQFEWRTPVWNDVGSGDGDESTSLHNMNRVCRDLTVCGEFEVEVAAATTTSDRVCAEAQVENAEEAKKPEEDKMSGGSQAGLTILIIIAVAALIGVMSYSHQQSPSLAVQAGDDRMHIVGNSGEEDFWMYEEQDVETMPVTQSFTRVRKHVYTDENDSSDDEMAPAGPAGVSAVYDVAGAHTKNLNISMDASTLAAGYIDVNTPGGAPGGYIQMGGPGTPGGYMQQMAPSTPGGASGGYMIHGPGTPGNANSSMMFSPQGYSMPMYGGAAPPPTLGLAGAPTMPPPAPMAGLMLNTPDDAQGEEEDTRL